MSSTRRIVQKAEAYNLELRAYMVRIFNYMAVALVITGTTSYLTFETGLVSSFYSTEGISSLGWIVTFSPLIIAFLVMSGFKTMGLNDLKLLMVGYSVAMGLSLSHIFITYAALEITRVFFITASLFLAMSIYGYVTKKDLTNVGSFMIMGLIGIIIASLVNIFLKSAAIYFVISILSVFVFVGLTAYDVQKLKDNFNHIGYEYEGEEKRSLMGALILYMDFVNLFLALLHLFGNRKK